MKKLILLLIVFLLASSICYAGEIRKHSWRKDLYGNPVYKDNEDNVYKRDTLRTDLYGNPVYKDSEGGVYKRLPLKRDIYGNPVYKEDSYF